MKKLILLVTVSLLALPLSAQFKAKMVIKTMGKERAFTVFSSDEGYRYEFNEDGQKGVVIVKKGSSEVIMLMPQQKMAMISGTGSPMAMSSDPLKAFEHYQKSGILKEVGRETINGISCIKSELRNNATDKYGKVNQILFTMWYSEEYQFPVKIINHIDGSKDSGFELRNVELWSADKSSFSIPDDYQIMGTPGPERLPSASQREAVIENDIQNRGKIIEGAPAVRDADISVSMLIDMHFTSPESGEIWEKGRTYTIRWDKTGGTENAKILLKDLMNQSSLWVSTGEDHVIQNTGYYSFRVPTNLPESAFELQIMTPDESYMNTSKKFYIGLTDTDLSVKAINFGKSWVNYGSAIWYYIVSEIWLQNKGTSSLNEVTVNWKIVREPSGVVEKQGDIAFKNITPDTWNSENIKVRYYIDGTLSNTHDLGGRLEPGEMFVLILNADIDNRLGEMELTRNDNTYRTEILYDTNY